MISKILVIGLGSMGKRRIRCLQSLGISDITGFDLREDRRNEAGQQYGIKIIHDANNVSEFNALIISVPPDVHHVYMKLALKYMIPAFIEASVVDTDMGKIISDANKKQLLLAPSCTMWYHPAVKKVAEVIQNNELGKLSFCLYHSGQYLPDWHTYEKVSEFYVSNKETGGAREIVPFEMTWLSKILGFPHKVTGMYKKTIEIAGAENIDDTYSALLDYDSFIVNINVDVVSRFATRRLFINGDKKQLYWDWNDSHIKIYDSETAQWIIYDYRVSAASAGYNKNITEQIYIDELKDFLRAADGEGSFPNSLENDHKVLKLLYSIEESNDSESFVNF